MRSIFHLLTISSLFSCGLRNDTMVFDKTKDFNNSIPYETFTKNSFQKINYSDKFYGESLSNVTHDTVTKSGFYIEYFVLDSTRYEDLYIVWGNAQFKDTFEFKQVLALEDYEFAPHFIEENKNFLILEYDCAQLDCSGYLFLSKKTNTGYRQFAGVLQEFDSHNLILFNNQFNNSETDSFFLYNLQKDYQYIITFEEKVVFQSAILKQNTLTIIVSKSEFSNELYKRTIQLN